MDKRPLVFTRMDMMIQKCINLIHVKHTPSVLCIKINVACFFNIDNVKVSVYGLFCFLHYDGKTKIASR